MKSPRHSTAGTARDKRIWLLPVAACAGIVVAIIVAAAFKPVERPTESDLRTKFAELLLRKSTNANGSDGGAIGPWWVAAESGDAATGRFLNFQLSSDSLQLAARESHLIVDPEAATFRFELEDVVLIKVSSKAPAEAGNIVHMDHYTLGPVPLRAVRK